MPRKCPRPETLLEYLSIQKELSFFEKLPIQWHARFCAGCQNRMQEIQENLNAHITPEPEITPSLISVYSRLQRDETLILKGWKLGNLTGRPRPAEFPWKAWAFRGGVVGGLGLLLGIVFWGQQTELEAPKVPSQRVPFAQIRYEDENRTQVHYVQPELIHSVEFQTTNYP